MKYKSIFCAALACSLLTLPASALEASSETTDISNPLATTENKIPESSLARPAYMEWVSTYGTITELGEKSILMQKGGEDTSALICHVSEETIILNAVSGEAMTYDQLKANETIYVYTAPVMTMSIPPQTNAKLILAAIPADYFVPTCHLVTSVTEGEKGITVHTAEAVNLHLTSDEFAVVGDGKVESLVPGDRIIAWYSVVAESYPAQAWPTQAVILPGEYAGWLSTDGDHISLNGTKLELDAFELPQMQDDALMLPLRKVAEALNCQVTWDAAQPGLVAVSNAAGETLYTISIDSEDGIPSFARSGVTFIPLHNLLNLHNLFLAD